MTKDVQQVANQFPTECEKGCATGVMNPYRRHVEYVASRENGGT